MATAILATLPPDALKAGYVEAWQRLLSNGWTGVTPAAALAFWRDTAWPYSLAGVPIATALVWFDTFRPFSPRVGTPGNERTYRTKVWTPEQYANDKTPKPRHLVEDLIIFGVATLLVAEAKLGKTWFVLALIGALCDAVKVAGVVTITFFGLAIDAERVRILYLIEEPRVQLGPKAKLFRLMGAVVVFAHRSDVPAGLLADAQLRADYFTHLMHKHRCNVLVVDTIQAWMPAAETPGRSVDELQPLLTIIEQKAWALILVHHAGRSGTSRGASSLEGAVGIIARASRLLPDVEGSPRVIRQTGRGGERTIVSKLDNYRYALSYAAADAGPPPLQPAAPQGATTAIGAPAGEDGSAPVNNRYLAYVAGCRGQGATIAGAMAALNMKSKSGPSEAFGLLLKAGAIVRRGDGGKSDPFVFYLPEWAPAIEPEEVADTAAEPAETEEVPA